jgi:hypothetical protein
MIRAKGTHSRMRRSGLPDALGTRELIADGQLADSLARGGKHGITQHRRNRRKTRLAHAAQRHRPVGRRLQMHFDLARRSIDPGDLKQLEVVLLGARF